MTTKIIAIALIVVSILTLALPAFAASYVYAKYDGVGIWDDPDMLGASAMTYVHYGTRLTVLDSNAPSGFIHVTYNGYYGYVDKGDVTSKDPYEPTPTPKPTKKPSPTKNTKKNTNTETAAATKAPSLYADFAFAGKDRYVQVSLNNANSKLNMRWAPNGNDKTNIIASYENGAVLHVIAESDGWVQVLDEENWRVGFMAADYLIDVEGTAGSSDTLG